MKYIETEKNAIVSARKKFAAMAGTYCLGVFNDNFFKQAVLLVAVSSGLAKLQGPATVLFALPFILFSAYAGWFADRFPKRKVVIAAKALEVGAMLTGAYGLLSGNWACILAMVFLMGAQSAFFSPALNGSIPELYPEHYVPKANALLKLFTTLSILAGVALAGLALDLNFVVSPTYSSGHLVVAALVIFIALTGFFASFGVDSREAANRSLSFPWLGPVQSITTLRHICRDKQLYLALAAHCFFYFLASIVVLTLNVYGVEQLGLSRTATSMMSMSLMMGVGIGSLFAAKIMSMELWSRHLVPSALGMAAGLSVAGLVPLFHHQFQVWLLAAALMLTGIAGGLFLIPVTSCLQVRPNGASKGRVLGGANFCGFISILLSGVVFTLLSSHFMPSVTLHVLSIFSCMASFFFFISRMRVTDAGRPLLGSLLRGLLSLRYRVEVKGMDSLELEKGKGILFLPNHPALIDPVIVMSHLYRKFRPRPLSDRDQVSKPLVRQIMRLVKPITIPSPRKNGRRSGLQVRRALQEVITCLKNGEEIVLYPAGRLCRSSQEELSANSAVETIVHNVPDIQVVLIRTRGLWGSSFSRANSMDPSLFCHLKKYLLAILSAGMFFLPKRRVSVELVRDHVVPSMSGRKTINAHLQNFYNTRAKGNCHVPYFWWQGSREEMLAEPVMAGQGGKVKSA